MKVHTDNHEGTDGTSDATQDDTVNASAVIYQVKGMGTQPIEKLSVNELGKPYPEHATRDIVDKKPQVGSVLSIIVLAIVAIGFVIVRMMMPF